MRWRSPLQTEVDALLPQTCGDIRNRRHLPSHGSHIPLHLARPDTLHKSMHTLGGPQPNEPKILGISEYRYLPLLKNIRRGLIDPNTPDNAKTRTSAFDRSTLHLIFSDESNQDGLAFYEGDDPLWTVPNLWNGATKDLEWYDSDAVTNR